MEWIRDQGGASTIFERNRQKAERIYSIIDSSNGFYSSVVEPQSRSQMNIPFRIGEGINGANGNESLEVEFLRLAQAQHMLSLKGHRSVGGLQRGLMNTTNVSNANLLLGPWVAFEQACTMR